MSNKRFRFILSMAAILSVLASSLSLAYSAALGNSSTGKLECPPMDASLVENPSFIKSLSSECRAQLRSTSPVQQRALSQSLLLATGGPDDFGYTFDDTVPVNWVSATTDSGVTGDENSGFLNLGFNFPFYGFNYSQLYFSTNGLTTFNFHGSVCCIWGGTGIPNAAIPNNYIAPFWDDLVVGPPYNNGGIFYSNGSDASGNYFLLEWRDVTTYAGSDPFSFEVFLYENGNILIQHQNLPANYLSTVGIENNFGDDGLEYHAGDTGLSASKAILFSFPTQPTARLVLSPANPSKFASTNGSTNFTINIFNIGSAGTDTYNLSLTSVWPAALYQDGCVTPLTDTNADSVIDTGPLPQGSSLKICVSFSPPAGLNIGDGNSGVLTASSSVDATKTRSAVLSMVIPASFAQVFEDYVNAAMAFQLNGPGGSTITNLTGDFYFATGLASMRMPDGRYIYAWRKPEGNFPDSHSNIEFTLLNADGTFNVPVTQVTNNVGTGQTYDYAPAVAVASNGNIGLTWYRWIVDNNTGMSNYNMYFAMLSSTGALLYGPANLTNNTLFDNFDNLDVPHFFSPAIAATGDNRFVLSWQDFRSDGASIFNNNLWLAVQNANGTGLINPALITSDGSSVNPVLNSLSGNNAVLSYASNQVVSYFVVGSDGSVSSSHVVPNAFTFQSTDAVALPNGSTALAWTTTGQDVGYVLLDAANNITLGPVFATNPYSQYNRDISVTYDSSNRIMMTWSDDDSSIATKLFYTLADSAGTFISPPTSFRSSPDGVLTSANGQGNAPIISAPQTIQVNIDVIPGNPLNIVSSKLRILPVAILSGTSFNARTDVKQSSLTFGKTGNEASLLYCFAKSVDVNHDLKPDLLCLFDRQKTGLTVGDTQAVLRGSTQNGILFEGRDTVKFLKR